MRDLYQYGWALEFPYSNVCSTIHKFIWSLNFLSAAQVLDSHEGNRIVVQGDHLYMWPCVSGTLWNVTCPETHVHVLLVCLYFPSSAQRGEQLAEVSFTGLPSVWQNNSYSTYNLKAMLCVTTSITIVN